MDGAAFYMGEMGMSELRKAMERTIRSASKHTHNSTEWFDCSLWEEGECPNIEWILDRLEKAVEEHIQKGTDQ